MSQASKSVILLLSLVCLLVSMSSGQVPVLTQHNDNARTGQNLQETVLNTSTVNVSSFGKLFSLPVDSNIYVQPLYVPNLTIQGKTRNVVYVGTQLNSVYAFDADSGSATPLWTVNLGTPVPAQDICVTDPVECPYTDVIPVIGILATPVIDPVSGTIYVVANTKDSSANYHYQLHALDLITGAEKFGGPEEITATGFTPFTQLNHPGLLLANGMIYMGFGSVGDFPTWHGWVLAYNATTLQPVAAYNSTPQNNSVGGAGIWQTGNGLVADASGNIYAVTSNGTFDVDTGGKDFGSAYLKLSGSALAVLDYFVPYNQSMLNPETDNVDLGSGGPLLIPNTTLLVGGGKDAVVRVVDTTNMGKYTGIQNTNLQNIAGATNPPIFGSPVYWNSPNLGPLIYIWGQGDNAKAWSFNAQTSLLGTTPAMMSTFKGTSGWNDQAALSISANGSTAGTGILWASMPWSGISNPGPVPGILYAMDATSLKELWDSQMNASRDSVGNYAKFMPPTVANGKVYLSTFSGQLLVYGPNPPSSSQISFVQANAATPQSATSSVSVPFKAAQNQGNLNIVVVGWDDTTTTVQSVMDSLGNQYALAAGPIQGVLTQAIYYAKDILGGSNSVTVTFSKSASFPDIRVLEYSGADITSPIDVVASASGNSATANSGSATTTVANELIFGANTVFTGNQAPGTNFTLRILTSPNSDLAEDRAVLATGTYSASATLTASGPWVMQMVALKASGSSGTGGSVPTLSSVSPASGSSSGGTAVTLTGTNFVAGATVSFGGTAATNVTVVSSTSITATTPAHAAGVVNVVVSDTGGSVTLTNGFTYASPAPTLSSVSPASGSSSGGAAVTLTGTNFVAGATVSFGGTAATNVTVVSSTSITATTPAHAAGAVNVVVSDTGGSVTLTNGFTYSTSTVTIGFAQVASATPQSPVASVKVTYPQAETAGDLNLVLVGWNDTSATVQSVMDSLGNPYVIAAGPVKGTAVTQSVYYAKNILGGSNSVTVTFNQAAAYPDVRVLEYKGLNTTAPLDVVAGASGSSGSNTVVSSGGATTTSGSELIFGAGMTNGGFNKAGTSFTAEVITPDGDIAEDEVVSSTGSYGATATLAAYGSQNWVMQMVALKASGSSGTGGSVPTLSSVSPASGSSSGGTAVTLTGTNFVAGATVSFGGTAATNVTVVSSTSITATTPAHAAGVVNVVVSDTGGSVTLTNGFTYASPAPTLSSVSPASGSSSGGAAVTLTGTNFVAGATVSFGGTAATNVTVVSSTSITATTPAHAAGAVNVVVSDTGGSVTLTNGFTYSTSTVTIGFAQVASATPQSPVASVKVTYPQAETAGDLNLVVVGWNDTSATVQSVMDSLGNPYVIAAGPVKGTAVTQSVYYAKNILGGSNSVTVTFNQAAAYPDVRVLEYKGLNTTAPLDVVTGASGSSGSNTVVSSGGATTTSGSELIFGAGMTNGGFNKAGTSFTAQVITPDGDIAENEVVSSTGSYGATATLGPYGSQNWIMQMVTLKQ